MNKKTKILCTILLVCVIIIVPIVFSGCNLTNGELIKTEWSNLKEKIQEIDFSKIWTWIKSLFKK